MGAAGGAVLFMWIIGWLIMGLIVAAVASGRGRSGFGWFFYGFLIWPLALIHVLALPKTDARLAHEAAVVARAQGLAAPAAGSPRLAPQPADQRRPCPFCAEMILPAARLCPHCRSDLTTEQARTLIAAAAPAIAAPPVLPRDVPVRGVALATDGIPGQEPAEEKSWAGKWTVFILVVAAVFAVIIAVGVNHR